MSQAIGKKIAPICVLGSIKANPKMQLVEAKIKLIPTIIVLFTIVPAIRANRRYSIKKADSVNGDIDFFHSAGVKIIVTNVSCGGMRSVKQPNINSVLSSLLRIGTSKIEPTKLERPKSSPVSSATYRFDPSSS